MLLSAWLMLITSIVAICLIFWHQSPIIKMLAIIATTFTGMKVVAVTESYRDKTLSLSFKQWGIFAAGWAGMRAQPPMRS